MLNSKTALFDRTSLASIIPVCLVGIILVWQGSQIRQYFDNLTENTLIVVTIVLVLSSVFLGWIWSNTRKSIRRHELTEAHSDIKALISLATLASLMTIVIWICWLSILDLIGWLAGRDSWFSDTQNLLDVYLFLILVPYIYKKWNKRGKKKSLEKEGVE